MAEQLSLCPGTNQPCEFIDFCTGSREFMLHQPQRELRDAVDEAMASSFCSEERIAATERLARDTASPIAFLAHLSVAHLRDTRSFFKNRTVA